MNSALLLAGQPRTMDYCHPSQKEHLLNVYHPDVFICTDSRESDVRQLYAPKKIRVVTQEECDTRVAELRCLYSKENLVLRALSVAYKAMWAARLLREQEIEQGWRYDCVFISRFDVAFNRIQPVAVPKPHTFYAPKNDAIWKKTSEIEGIHWGGYSAHLAWGDSPTMCKLANIYFTGPDWNALAVIERPKRNQMWGQNPEFVLKYFLEEEGVDVVLTDIVMMLIRGTSESPLAWDKGLLSRYPEFNWRK